jgi:cytochrome c oxidase cbb3-type subunit 3
MSDDKKTKREDELLDSSYDGIQEYDNDLPRWWIQLFYLTIAFGLFYATYVHLSGAPTDLEVVAAEMEALKTAANKRETVQNLSLGDSLNAKIGDLATVSRGKEIFTGKCAACHGQNGEGLVGPNLTDDYTIHGASIEAIHKVITAGVLEKGMLSWKGIIPDEDITAVSVYVFSLTGTNLPGKAAEGNKK